MLRLLVVILLCVASTPTRAEEKDNWLELAKSGNPFAEYNLCKSYLYGENGRAKSGKRAFKWCLASANAGISSGQTLLAEMYRFGTYVRKDDAIARHYYLLAAEQGHVHAQYMLGRMAILQEPPDTKTACHWLRASAAQGYDKPQELLELLESNWMQAKGPETKGFCETVEMQQH